MQIPDEFTELKGRIVDGLLARLEQDDDEEAGPDTGYGGRDVDRCAALLDRYLLAVLAPSVHGDSDRIMVLVQSVVTALNELNEDCDSGLIEPEQREGLLELIVTAAAQAGLESEEDDITEEWREW